MTGVIRLSDSHYEPSEKAPGMVGVPGTRYIEILGTGEGKGTLHLILGREWEVKEAFRKGEVYEPVGDIKLDLDVS